MAANTLLIDQYPGRPPFFCHSFVRLLTKAVIAQQVGAMGTWLLSVIAHQEDAIRYRRAVSYYDSQLIEALGRPDQKTFAKYRKACVDQGWLHWSRSRARDVSYYWVDIPQLYLPEFNEDRATDEGLELLELAQSLRRKISVKSPSSLRRVSVESPSSLPPSIPIPDTSKTSPTNPEDAAGGGLIEDMEPAGGLAAPDEATHPQLPRPTLAAGSAAPSELPRESTDPEPSLLSRLKKFGLSRAADTLREAAQRGHTAETIDAVVAFAEQHAGHWGGGAIRYRLTQVDIDVPAAEGWPKPDPKAVAKAADERRRLAEAKRLSESTAAATTTQQVIDWSALEDRYRDRIATEALSDLKRHVPSVTARLLRTDADRSRPLIRRALLRAFAAADGLEVG